MKTQIIVVGKSKDKLVQKGVDDYLKRISRHAPVEIIRIKEEQKPTPSSEPAGKKKEAERIFSKVKPRDVLIALSEEGTLHNSVSFSEFFQEQLGNASGKVIFTIGSGAGLDDSVKERADYLLSLSPMTFPHQLALLLLTEQIYRAWSIFKNEPYHRA